MEMDRRPWILNTEFLKALEKNDALTVNAILDTGFDIDKNILSHDRNALHICITNGWHEMTKLLISRGCSLSLKDSQGKTALMLAVLKSDHTMVKLLLKNRADPTCKDVLYTTALHYACEINNLRIVRMITDSNKKIINVKNTDQKTPLAFACRFGNVNLIRHLLSLGADVNSLDYLENSPLFYALSNNSVTPEMITLLLDAGANVNELNSAKDTPLLFILRNCCFNYSDSRYQEIFHLLIDRGCDINASTNLGETALHLAVILNSEILVRKLLNRGANVDAQNDLALVPLFYALRIGSRRLVSLLLDAGADPRFISENSCKPPFYHPNNRRPVEGGVDPSTLLGEIIRQSKECPTLSHLCRCWIRKRLSTDIEKRSCQLSLPASLVNYIQLID